MKISCIPTALVALPVLTIALHIPHNTHTLLHRSPVAASGIDGLTDNLNAAYQAAALNATNTYRTQHGSAPVTWSPALADFTRGYAAKCVWEHSNVHSDNLAQGTDNVAEAINLWGNERKDHDFNNLNKFDHFTAMVWKKVAEMGCATQKCPGMLGINNGFYTVCAYEPGGNVLMRSGDPYRLLKENIGPQISGPGM